MGDITDWMFESGMLDQPDGEEYDWDREDGGGGPVHGPRCKFCGSYAVAWVHTGVRWRLYSEDMRKPHLCQTTQVTTDDFDDVTKD